MHAFHSLFGAHSRRRLCPLLDRRRLRFRLCGLLVRLVRGPLSSPVRVVPAATPESGFTVVAPVVLEAAGVRLCPGSKIVLFILFIVIGNSLCTCNCVIKGEDGVVSSSRDSSHFTSILKFDLLIVTDCLTFLIDLDQMLSYPKEPESNELTTP